MLIADGGGGYGGTNWNGMDVVQMWQAVESQDTERARHYLDLAHKDVEKLEGFMGRR